MNAKENIIEKFKEYLEGITAHLDGKPGKLKDSVINKYIYFITINRWENATKCKLKRNGVEEEYIVPATKNTEDFMDIYNKMKKKRIAFTDIENMIPIDENHDWNSDDGERQYRQAFQYYAKFLESEKLKK